MTETTAYSGSCHCGNVRFRATTDLAKIITCNCSICSRTGALLTFVDADHFVLEAGEGAQSDYRFNKHHIHHLFCTNCGVRSYAHGLTPAGATMYAVNVRCLEGVDLAALTLTPVDGKSL